MVGTRGEGRGARHEVLERGCQPQASSCQAPEWEGEPAAGGRRPVAARGSSRTRSRPTTRARRNSTARGFTLLELIVVVAIIGILAAIVMPALKDIPRRAREAVLKTDLQTFRKLIDEFHGDKGHYPEELQDLVDQGYLRSLPPDPFTGSSTTWTVVREEVDPENPPVETETSPGGQPGIIDVHSGSDARALDGSKYDSW